MPNQRQQLIRDYQRRIKALDKPKMRITKKRKRRLVAGALCADLIIDPVIGLLPVIGDIGSATVIHYTFLGWFNRYDVDGSEYITKGKTISDAVVGFLPAVGDFLDLLFLSWLWTIYSAVKDVREEDKKRIKQYNKKVRRLQRELQYQLTQLQNKQLAQSRMQGVREQQDNRSGQRSEKRGIPSENVRQDAQNVAPTRYNRDRAS